MAPPVQPFPLSLFPLGQARIRALLEEADEAAHAGFTALRDRLISQAREGAMAIRSDIVGFEA